MARRGTLEIQFEERMKQVNHKILAVVTSLFFATPLVAAAFEGASTAGWDEPVQEQVLKVDLNEADVDELEKLPGIGEKVAQRGHLTAKWMAP